MKLACPLALEAWARFIAPGTLVSGERQQAEGVLKKLEEIGRQQYVPPIICGAVFVGLGESDKAFDCLRRAAQERNWQIAWLHLDAIWDGLRSDPGLHMLQAELGLPA